MSKLTNVSCEYTGGGVYVYTALLNNEVWFMTDFLTYDSYGCYDAPLDIVESDILPDGHINYDGHWKEPPFPLPQWIEILMSLREVGMFCTADEISNRLPADRYCRVGEQEVPTNEHSERLETIARFIDIFDDFLDEKQIDIPNPERDDDPCASNIYGTDYGILFDRIESLLVRLGYIGKEN